MAQESARKTSPPASSESVMKCEICGKKKKPVKVFGLTIHEPQCNCMDDYIDRKEKEKIHREELERRIKKQQRLDEITNSHFMRGEYENISFDTLTVNKDNERIFKTAKRYLENLVENVRAGRSIGLLGKAGTGKTALFIAMHREIITSMELTSALVNVPILFAILQQSMKHSGAWEIIQTLSDADVLFIDDLMRGVSSKWRTEVLYYILEHRYPLPKATFFSSNTYGETVEEVKTEMVEFLSSPGIDYEVSNAIVDRLFRTNESRRLTENKQPPRVAVLTTTGESWR